MVMEHMPQIPSRQSWSKWIGSSPSLDEAFVDDVDHLEEGSRGGDLLGFVGLNAAFGFGVFLTPDFQSEVEEWHDLLVGADGGFDFFEDEFFLVKVRWLAGFGVLPSGDILVIDRRGAWLPLSEWFRPELPHQPR